MTNKGKSDKGNEGGKNVSAEHLDQFTVLQDVASADLSALSYDVNNNMGGDEDFIASNPLMGITNQRLDNNGINQEFSIESKDISLTDQSSNTESSLSARSIGEPSWLTEDTRSITSIENSTADNISLESSSIILSGSNNDTDSIFATTQPNNISQNLTPVQEIIAANISSPQSPTNAFSVRGNTVTDIITSDDDIEDNNDAGVKTTENEDVLTDDIVSEAVNDGNNGHGNDADGVDESNPGNNNGNNNSNAGGNGKGNNDGDNGHGNDADGFDESNPGNSTGTSNPNIDIDIDVTVTPAIEIRAGIEISGGNGKDTLTGTDGNDIIDGGNGKDTISGGGGDDTLYGGNGKDTAHYSGDFNEYAISSNDDGSFTISDTVEGRDGDDTVFDIEFFNFHDGEQEIGSASWLDAIEQTAQTQMTDSGSDADQNWLNATEFGNEDTNTQNQDNLIDLDNSPTLDITDLAGVSTDQNTDFPL